ncbi:TRAP transporter small permease [Chloroflexota bacterium]
MVVSRRLSLSLRMKVISVFDHTIDSLALFAAVLMVFIMLAVVADVVTRYALGKPIFWVVEICEYSLLWITFLATASLLKREEHVKMDLVLNRLNPGTQARMNVITSIIGAIACLIVTWYSAMLTSDMFQMGYFVASLNLRPPKGPILAIIPIGSFLLFVQFMRRTYGFLRSFRALPDNGEGSR